MKKIKTICEIGINHNGCKNIAKKLIDVASNLGCDYVKIQKRDPDLCVPDKQKNKTRMTPWGEMSYIDYKKKIELSYDDLIYLNEYSKRKKIIFFASVWDLNSIKLIKKLKIDIVKIPSALITNIPLCKFARKNFKKLIISTGMSDEKEIENCIKNCDPDVILHTNSTYPCPVEDLNLNYIKWLTQKWPSKEIGYSGHEKEISTTFAAVGLGATWIERHITIDKNYWGSDQSSSLDCQEFETLIKGIKCIEKSMSKLSGPRELCKSEEIKKEYLRNV